jgi:hypothetical protein
LSSRVDCNTPRITQNRGERRKGEESEDSGGESKEEGERERRVRAVVEDAAVPAGMRIWV